MMPVSEQWRGEVRWSTATVPNVGGTHTDRESAERAVRRYLESYRDRGGTDEPSRITYYRREVSEWVPTE